MTDTVPAAIVVTRAAVEAIAHEARASGDGTETGGILLGTAESDSLVIRHAGGPGRHATRRTTFFQRDLNHAQALGDWAFEKDRSVWIGEWHTHLRAPAVPSSRDLATYRGLLADPELAFDFFVAIILAEPTNEWTQPQIATWLVTPTQTQAVITNYGGVANADPPDR
ncbi:Mov34/MPN/PAD-1 family protein [Amycolatopsis sp. NPDC051716]|uniref:Mov34/MPN/PAD-1 family protein n=1 Tax=Amycolatopsis sp. NPDC051716 TaxID=3155804 RepID=UPI0034384B61